MRNIIFILFFSIILTGCGFIPVFTTTCRIVPSGSNAMLACTDGNNVTIKDGKDGSAGRDGQDLTPITAVQLCPTYTANQYPEVAFCIGGKLFANYYAPPSSGLVYLPAGNYTSTQTNGCSFTVTAGCEVSN